MKSLAMERHELSKDWRPLEFLATVIKRAERTLAQKPLMRGPPDNDILQ